MGWSLLLPALPRESPPGLKERKQETIRSSPVVADACKAYLIPLLNPPLGQLLLHLVNQPCVLHIFDSACTHDKGYLSKFNFPSTKRKFSNTSMKTWWFKGTLTPTPYPFSNSNFLLITPPPLSYKDTFCLTHPLIFWSMKREFSWFTDLKYLFLSSISKAKCSISKLNLLKKIGTNANTQLIFY